jgi:hypothetical protein
LTAWDSRPRGSVQVKQHDCLSVNPSQLWRLQVEGEGVSCESVRPRVVQPPRRGCAFMSFLSLFGSFGMVTSALSTAWPLVPPVPACGGCRVPGGFFPPGPIQTQRTHYSEGEGECQCCSWKTPRRHRTKSLELGVRFVSFCGILTTIGLGHPFTWYVGCRSGALHHGQLAYCTPPVAGEGMEQC